jgi:4-amino-4-deoxy-L-arabinose transferase-like glycosyltransferase
MPATRGLGFGGAILFLIVLIVAGGARAWYLIECASKGMSDGPLLVQDRQPVLAGLPAGAFRDDKSPPTEQDALVHNLKEHNWFGSLAPFANQEEQTAHVSPGYSWLLAWLNRSPISPGPSEWTVRWIQCCLGTLTAIFYFFFALRAFESRYVATLAGLLTALNPFWIINTAQLDDGVLATFLVAGCVAFGARAGRTGGALSGLLYGLGLAGLALVRAALLPFAIVALVWLLIRCRRLNWGWLCALLALLGFVIGLSLWTFRNYKVFHDVVPIADSSFYHLWIGNNPRATGGPLSEEIVLETLAQARSQNANSLREELGHIKNQQERYRQLAWDVRDQIRSDPKGFFQHRTEAGLSFFFGEEWLRSRELWQRAPSEKPAAIPAEDNEKADESPELPPWLNESYPAILYGTLFFMLLLGVVGWRWSYGWRHAAMPASLAMIWIPLPYILSHADLLSGPRLPLDGVLLCYAAFALACLTWPGAAALFRGEEARADSEERQRTHIGA